MRSYSRRFAAVTAAALFAAGAAVPPASAGLGPAVIDDHDSHVAPRAYDVSSSTGGTVFATDNGGFGRVYLAAGAMTTGTPLVDLGPRPLTHTPTTISGSRVAMPVAGADFDTPITQVRSCLIGTCPTMSTLTVPASWQYAGNADDAAVLYNPTTDQLGIVPWTGGSVTATWAMPVPYEETPVARADATGIVVSGEGQVTYVNRTANTVHNLDYGDGAVLTPTYVVWYAVAVGEPTFDETRIYRVLRSTTEPTPTPSIVESLAGAPGIESLTASDAGVGWTIPNEDSEGTLALWTMPYDGTPILYARPLTTSGLATYPSTGQILVNDRLAGIPGFYRITPGSYTGTLTGLVPVRGAITISLAVAHGRAVYIDDTTADLPLFTRTVTNGSPGPEALVTDRTAGGVGLSGPYLAYTRPRSASLVDVVYGRMGGAMSTRILPRGEVGHLSVSGQRVLITGGTRSRVIDIPSGAETDLGRTYAAMFGEYVALLNYDTGALTRRNLDTNVVQTIRGAVAGCSSFCIDETNWGLAVWGHEVVFGYGHAGTTPGVVSGLWNGNTNTTTPTPMLNDAEGLLFTEIAYWSGLLLVAHHGADVKLYDMRNSAAETLVDGFAEEPLALDGNVAAWRPLSDLKAVVRDVRDFVPGHTPEIRYLSGVTPAAFGTPSSPEWSASFVLSQDTTGSLVIRSGSPTGTVVRTIPFGTIRGEATAAWDGKVGEDADAPQGTYYWSLESDGPIVRANGTTPVSGSMFLSRTALGAPTLTAPSLLSDVTASAAIPLTWTAPAGAPAGTKYVLERSVNGAAFTTSTTTTATSTSFGATRGNTYRFRVHAVDPAGRVGATSTVRTTVVPYDHTGASAATTGTWFTASGSSFWGGSHRYSSQAGATYTFRAQGTAFWLIGTRSTNFGQFQVSVDGGAYSGLIDSRSSSLQYRKVLFSKGSLSNTTHTIRVRVYGTRGRPYLSVDGIGFLR